MSNSIVITEDGLQYEIIEEKRHEDSCLICDAIEICDKHHGNIPCTVDGIESIGVNCQGGLRLLNNYKDIFNNLERNV